MKNPGKYNSRTKAGQGKENCLFFQKQSQKTQNDKKEKKKGDAFDLFDLNSITHFSQFHGSICLF